MGNQERAIDYVLEDIWDGSPKVIQASLLMALHKGIVDEIMSGKCTEEEIGKVFTLMRERVFPRSLKACIESVKGMIKENESLSILKNMQNLVVLYFSQDRSNKSKELLKDYLDVLLGIVQFQDFFMLHVIRNLHNKNISDHSPEEKEKIRELLHIHSSPAFYNLIIPVVDGLLVRKNNE